MTSLHPSLLALLARERTRAFDTPRLVEPRPPSRRRRLARREPAPAWGGGRTVNPCLAGCC
jgi:hypothetical protein